MLFINKVLLDLYQITKQKNRIMTSKQIISTIASMAKDNEKMTESILGGHIVKECVKLNEKPFVYKEVKPLIDSCCYLGKQIEICTEKRN